MNDPRALLALAVVGAVFCPPLGPVVVYLAEKERKRLHLDDLEPPALLMAARLLGYVGTALLCLDLLAIIGIVGWMAFTAVSTTGA